MNNLPLYLIYNILEYTGKFKIKNAAPVSIIPKDDIRYGMLEKISKIKCNSKTYSYVVFDDIFLSDNFYISFRIDNYEYHGNYNLYFSKFKYKNDLCLEYIVYSL